MKEGCIFCKIASKDKSADIIYENKEVVAFSDINPQAPVHILIIPKEHIEKISDLNSKNVAVVNSLILAANKLAKDKGIAEAGYRLVFNCGSKAGQAVYHIHLHLLGGRNMNWPPG